MNELTENALLTPETCRDPLELCDLGRRCWLAQLGGWTVDNGRWYDYNHNWHTFEDAFAVARTRFRQDVRAKDAENLEALRKSLQDDPTV